MARLRSRVTGAAAVHRQAMATLVAATTAVGGSVPHPAATAELLARLRAAAAELAPGWLSHPFDQLPQGHGHHRAPQRATRRLTFVRIGVALPGVPEGFPVVVPLIGAGHLTLTGDAQDRRVAGLLRAVLVRLLASAQPGSLLVRAVDPTSDVSAFAPLAPAVDAGLLPPPAAGVAGVRAALAEAERWIHSHRPGQSEKTLLIALAGLPPLDARDVARLVAVAQHGPERGVHLVVAGWPPPAATPGPPLPHGTAITLGDTGVRVTDPPDGFGTPTLTTGLSTLTLPIAPDPDPPAGLVSAICHDLLSAPGDGETTRLSALLGAQLWSEESGAGLLVPVGHDGERVVTLPFNDLTPHWLVGGRTSSGKTAFLTTIIYGLASRYSPEELALYLVSFAADRTAFAEFAPSPHDPTWLPHVRAVGLAADREYGVAVLREVADELTRRAALGPSTRFAELRAQHRLPRIVCVLDECQALFDEEDSVAAEAAALLRRLTRDGRPYGIHLVVAGRTTDPTSSWHTARDLGHVPVRVALPGGDGVLAPSNDAAAGLAVGCAVVNTAGGLGGPPGATRGHERVIRFPNPRIEARMLTDLRRRMVGARPGIAPPPVFTGYAHHDLASDPTYRAAVAGRAGRPAALLGRAVDVPQSTVAFEFDTSPGRHLVLVGSESAAVDVLDAAARSVAVHHAPGTTRFVIATGELGRASRVAALAAAIGQRHEVTIVNWSGVARALDRADPCYLVVFGIDADGREPSRQLTRFLRDGPNRGQHLLAWWREPRDLHAHLGDTTDGIDGWVFLDVPSAEVAQVIGHRLTWRPQRQRGLLYDRRTDHHLVFMPFTRTERAS